MTVAELIERLGTFDPAREVRIAQPTHNYWRETGTAPVDGVAVEIIQQDGVIVDEDDTETSTALVIHG